MSEARGHDIANLSYSATIELLHKEGYQLNETEGKGEYIAVVVHSWDEFDAKYYKEVGYSVIHHESHDDLIGFMGVLLCGGVYTCAALFKGEKNITGKNPLETFLPSGDVRVEEDEDDEDDEEENEDEEENDKEEEEEDEEEDPENGAVATKRPRANEDEDDEDDAADDEGEDD